MNEGHVTLLIQSCNDELTSGTVSMTSTFDIVYVGY